MLACGATPDAIAASTGLDPVAVEAHLAACVSPSTLDDTPDNLERSDQRLRALAEKISLAGTGAGLQGDAKSLLTALSISLRVEMEIRRRLETKAEIESTQRTPTGETILTVELLDQILATPPRCLEDTPAMRARKQVIRTLERIPSDEPQLGAICEQIETILCGHGYPSPSPQGGANGNTNN